MSTERYFVITGASGAGKSTLLAELHFLGHSTIPEVGRAVVREQVALGGRALPWIDQPAFLEAVLARNVHDHHAASSLEGPVFFDRAVPEIVAWAQLHRIRVLPHYRAAVARCRYNSLVFVTEPWPEIYVNDSERQRTFQTSIRWYEPTVAAYIEAGYELCIIPKGTVRERAEFVLAHAMSVA